MKVNMDKLAELDSHWSEVMELAVKYGFITQAYGGTATLEVNSPVPGGELHHAAAGDAPH